MPLYFLLLNGTLFRQRLRPALAASWRQRSVEPCQSVCTELLPAALAFADRYHTGREEILLVRVAEGLPFGRELWHALAGEMLWYGADDIPDIQTAPDALACLLCPGQPDAQELPRERFAPIQQAHYGARDLRFGSGYYRPEHAGYNDDTDVIGLAEYLAAVDPSRWTPADLATLPELGDAEERAEELAYVRDWFPALRDLYAQARQRGQVVVCEVLAP
jgi:hypothetical protein